MSTDINLDSVYNAEISACTLIDKKQERTLLTKAQQGDEKARNSLIEHNMRLVRSIASHYNCSSPLLTQSDLIQAGSMGLFSAISKFDLNTPYSFSTFATYHIKKQILNEIQTLNATVRKPANIYTLYKKIKQASVKLHQQLNATPTAAQIADHLGITTEQVKETEAFFIDPISTDVPLSSDEDAVIGDLVEDENIIDPVNQVFNNELRQAIMDILQTLSEKERRVIELRFGLDGGPQRSLTEIGKIMGYSHEWMRQVEERALSKLRQPIRKNKLQPFFEEMRNECA